MSLALGAVLLLILLLPPIVFYQLLVFGKADYISHALRRAALTEKVLAAALLALFTHCIALFMLRLLGCTVRFDVLFWLIGLDKWKSRDLQLQPANHEMMDYLLSFGFYNFIINLLAAAAGYFTGRKFSSRLSFLNHRWWFVFNGEFANNPNKRIDFKCDLVVVDAVVNTADGTMIYTGRLRDFTCNEANIDRLYLSNVFRNEFKTSKENRITKEIQKFSATDPPALAERLEEISLSRWPVNEPGEPIKIPSDIFILRYDQVLNLNVRVINAS